MGHEFKFSHKGKWLSVKEMFEEECKDFIGATQKRIKRLEKENKELTRKFNSIVADLNGTINVKTDKIEADLKNITADLNGVFKKKFKLKYKIGDRVIVNNKVKGKVEAGRIDGYDETTKNYLVDTYDGTGIGYKILETDIKLDLLDKAERKFLTEIFKMKDVKYIVITTNFWTGRSEYIELFSDDLGEHVGILPEFESGTMYKGLKRYEPYSKEDLGL